MFEVQVSGNIDSALTKLRHVRNTWNADLFLVVNSEKDSERASYLLNGSFHEIRDNTLVIDAIDIEELLTLKRQFEDLERRLR